MNNEKSFKDRNLLNCAIPPKYYAIPPLNSMIFWGGISLKNVYHSHPTTTTTIIKDL